MHLHVAGNACLDTTFRLKRFPLPGETLNAEELHEGIGGKGANQAVAAARTGADVSFWCALGKDRSAVHVLEALAQEDLDLHAASYELATDRSFLLVNGEGENQIVSASACARAFNPLDEGLPALWRRSDLLLMQGNLQDEVTWRTLQAARRDGLVTVMNPSPLPHDADRLLDEVDLLVCNAQEALAISGMGDLESAVAALSARVSRLIVTAGANGALLSKAGTSHRFPALQVAPVDSSGAGDCLAGTLCGLLARGWPLGDALRVAVQAASLSVSRPGTLSSFPSPDDISALASARQTSS